MATRADVEARIQELERGMDRLAGLSDPDPQLLVDFERDVYAALPDAREVDPDLAAVSGHPVLADGRRWRELASEVGAPAASGEADALIARLIGDQASALRDAYGAARDGADPDACFRALAEARAFDLEALGLRHTDPPLKEFRPRLRAAMLEAAAESPPGQRMREAWLTELLDRAEVVLTGIDEVEPDRAQARLALVVDDLEWHAHSIEKGRRRVRLRRRIRRLRAEQQERDLQQRLEERFGGTAVARVERTILWLILLVLAILAFEAILDPSPGVRFWLTVVDSLACVAFLWEFFYKLSVVRGRARWFVRHFLVDFLPSVPYGLVLLPQMDAARAGRAIRFLRIARLARYVRILRPLIRLMRAFGFLTRGLDRLVRKYGHLLNRNIVLYPTREERDLALRESRGLDHVVLAVQSRLTERWEQLLTSAPPERRERVARARVDGLEAVRADGLLALPVQDHLPVAPERDYPADEVLDTLARLTPPEVESQMGADLTARLARAIRVFSLPPIRWLPIVRRYVPRTSRGMADAEVVVAAARKSASSLKAYHDRWFWFADLYGPVTPAFFVDRVGTTMVKGSLRPAYRLLLFGLIFLLIKFFVNQLELGFLEPVYDLLDKLVSTFLQVLGGICFAILGVGWWLRRIAGQATDFFAQSAKAQYLSLTESIKSRHIPRDAQILERHVFAPERLVHPGSGKVDRFRRGVYGWLLEAQSGDGITTHFDPVERAVLVYRDSLDGALLGDSDTRTTAQLLGNPALRNLRLMSARFSRRDTRRLMQLDLERKRGLGGPYMWFSLVCQAIAHGTARLLVDYNRQALPLDQLERATPEEKRQYRAWLATERVADVAPDQVIYVTTHFNALHFLDHDEERDREVEARFGAAVVARLRRDRRHLFRRVFGTYPLHKRPRDERVINLFRFYQRWLAGGRALLVPPRLAWRGVRFCWRFLVWLKRCVREIRRPTFQVDADAVRGADFRTALRKIQRMRGPVAEAAIRLRARFDPEYLGIRVPGTGETGLEEHDAGEDLRFLACGPDFEAEIEVERKRTSRDMVRLGRLVEGGLLERLGVPRDREHLRAAAAAYVADICEVRRHLSGPEILAQVYERAARRDTLPRLVLPRFRAHGAFRRYWKEHGSSDSEARRSAWRATIHNVDGVADALEAWAAKGDSARAEGERILAGLLRHPERMTDQIVTLRTVQTLSLIDVLNYREHVYRLGDYAASGDDPGGSLDLR